MLKKKVLGERTRWEVYENMASYSTENLRRALASAPELLRCEQMEQLFKKYLPHWREAS